MTKEAIARAVHEANRALCIGLGDDSQPHFEDATADARESSIKSVEHRLANPDAPASAQHDQWMQDRLTKGWKYAPITDKPNKLHACLVPYVDLPVEQRAKDVILNAIVDAMAPLLPKSAQ